MATEFGDKTFFLATILAQKRHPLSVFLGAASALGFMTLGATTFGMLLPHFLNPLFTDVVSALIYSCFGLVMIHDAITSTEEGEEYRSAQEMASSKQLKSRFNAYIQTMLLIMGAEWGDRSQVATISLAAQSDFLSVFLGGFSAHLLCTAIAVLGGSFVVNRCSERHLLAMNAMLLLLFAAHSWLHLYTEYQKTITI